MHEHHIDYGANATAYVNAFMRLIHRTNVAKLCADAGDGRGATGQAIDVMTRLC